MLSENPENRTAVTLRRLALLILIAFSSCMMIFATTGQPFLWILSLCAVTALAAAAIIHRTVLRIILIHIAALFLALAIFESYLCWLRDEPADPAHFEGTYVTDYFTDDDLLGYGPIKGVSVSSARFQDEQEIYRVRYTIDDDGLRLSPPAGPEELGCVLFFGGSITFGEGVADEETMPYQVGMIIGRKYRIYNFGFHGYGPHQMLAALQGGRVDEIIRCQPSYVIYQAIIPHVERVIGPSGWDKRGPRFVQAPDGSVAFAGHFDDQPAALPVENRLDRWLTYDNLFGPHRSDQPKNVALYAEIVAEARSFVERNYPKARFEVLLWDDREERNHDRVLAALESKGLRLHRMTDILPEYDSDRTRYVLSRLDGHPSAATHRIIAQYVADHILAPGAGRIDTPG